MREHVFRFIGAVFLMILALLGIGAVLHILITLPWEGKGPEWVGAIGTVATLIGTIWLAMSGERKRKRDELDLAIIAAAEFALWIPDVKIAFETIKQILPRAREGNFGPVYRDCHTLLTGARVWNSESLKPLVVIPNHAAARLAFVSTRIRNLTAAFLGASTAEMTTIEAVRRLEEILMRQIQTCIDELEVPNRACVDFLNSHGFGRDLPVHRPMPQPTEAA
jgi:hypothetical protein